MRRFLFCSASILAILAATASAALATSNFHGYVLDVTGHPVSGAYVQLYEDTTNHNNWVNVGNCYSGAGGYYNCGSHPGSHYYYAKAAKAINCSMAYGFYPDTGFDPPNPGVLVYNNTTVVWSIVMNHARRIC